jgi:hypothetical protein
VGVSEVVQPDHGETKPPDGSPKRLGEQVRMDWIAVLLCEHQAPIDVGVSERATFGGLTELVRGEDAARLWVQGDGPPAAGRLW